MYIYISSVSLSSNLWSCDCLYLDLFTDWLESTSARVPDAGLLSCTTAHQSPATTIPMADDIEFCEETVGGFSSGGGLVAANGVARTKAAAAGGDGDIVNGVLAPAIAAAVTLLVLLAGLLVALLYRTQLKLCLYSRYRKNKQHNIWSWKQKLLCTNGRIK